MMQVRDILGSTKQLPSALLKWNVRRQVVSSASSTTKDTENRGWKGFPKHALTEDSKLNDTGNAVYR